MRFEIRYFFLEVGLSVRYYTVRALLFEFCRILNLSMEVPNVYIAIYGVLSDFEGGGRVGRGSKNPIWGNSLFLK